jgi:hypothetical protein
MSWPPAKTISRQRNPCSLVRACSCVRLPLTLFLALPFISTPRFFASSTLRFLFMLGLPLPLCFLLTVMDVLKGTLCCCFWLGLPNAIKLAS